MFNVTILKKRDVLGIFLGITLTILIVVIISRSFKKETEEKKFIDNVKTQIVSLSEKKLYHCMEEIIPGMLNMNEECKEAVNENNSKEENDILQTILKTQISSIDSIEQIKLDETDENKEDEKTENDNQVNLAQTNLPTQVITNNPISENYNAQYGNVKIKNETDYTLTEDMLKPDITIDNKNIILFHTHSCESYTPSEKYPYTPTGSYRTTDLNYTVTRVGTELENQLKLYNYNVIHNTDYHDYPAYNGSYTRSLATVENILKTNQADIIMDVHRDAIGSRSDYAPTVKIGDTDEAAQIMFVIGTNNGGLWHPNWNQNLKFAIKVQEKAEEMYPGLFKPIMLTQSRYNQHTGKYASIIEVGATGNTLEQCLNSMKYLAKVMDEVLK